MGPKLEDNMEREKAERGKRKVAICYEFERYMHRICLFCGRLEHGTLHIASRTPIHSVLGLVCPNGRMWVGINVM